MHMSILNSAGNDAKAETVLTKFYASCKTYIDNSLGDISWLNDMEWGAFGVAIALLLFSGGVAIYKEWKKPIAAPEGVRVQADPNANTFVEVLKALPELIKALSSAPAAVVLLVLGLLLVWSPPQEVEVPEICERVIAKQLQLPPPPADSEPSDQGRSDAPSGRPAPTRTPSPTADGRPNA